ncbi:putative cuticle protein [Operophtera brumata]|uniref:Putative cuticle protein n=1 Tax=Operophtera brumata TaxID=104452 RepID=A0A0L7LB70_OPEBR|nr:putative cuticle protein [Operophtera brumata]
MRFLIVASVLACASAVPSGLLAAPYTLAVAPVARLAPAVPTISAGDINGAAIDAHVEASDHLRASFDATRQLNDKVNELHGQAINNAEENAWRAVDNVKTVEAQLDGAAAGAAPILSKQLVGRVAPVVAAGPVVAASYAAPVVAAPYAAPVVAAPYASPVVSAPYAAPYAAAPYAAAPYSAYPALAASNIVSPYYGSPLEYPQAW